MGDRVGERSGLELSVASRQTAGLLVAAGILVAGATISPPASLSVDGQRTLAVFLAVVVAALSWLVYWPLVS